MLLTIHLSIGENHISRQYVPALTPLSIFSYSFRDHRSVVGDGNRSAAKLLMLAIDNWDFKSYKQINVLVRQQRSPSRPKDLVLTWCST